MVYGLSEKSLNLVGILCCLFVGLYGCVKPRIKEIEDAEVALAAARSAGAEKYLAEEFKRVEKKLAEARLRVKKKRYKAAKVLALESAEEARQAKSRAERRKEKARQEAEKAMAVAHKALCDLEEKKAINYDIEEYMEILNLFRQVQKEYDEGDYFEVVEKARSVTQRCNALQKKVQEIEARRKAKQARLEKLRQLEEAKRLTEAKKREEERKMSKHVVRAGDCLWEICQDAQIYNNALIWPIVYKANRSQIRDPDLIYPGQVFIIPRGLKEEQIDEAAVRAKNRGSWSLYDNK